MVGGGAPGCTSPLSAVAGPTVTSTSVAELVRLQLEATMDTVPPIEACSGRTKEIAPAEVMGTSYVNGKVVGQDPITNFTVLAPVSPLGEAAGAWMEVRSSPYMSTLGPAAVVPLGRANWAETAEPLYVVPFKRKEICVPPATAPELGITACTWAAPELP